MKSTAPQPAVVVVRDVHGDGRFQVRQFLTEGQCEPAEPFRKHSSRAVEPFDVTRADRPQVFDVLDATAFRGQQIGRSVATAFRVGVILDDDAVLSVAPGKTSMIAFG